MPKLSEKSQQPEKKCRAAEDIQDTCILISQQSTSARGDCTGARVRLPRCRFLPCPETTLPTRFPTSLATLPRDRSTSIEDYTEKESIHPSTLRHPFRD